MLKILGRANSINVRKVMWLCDEMGLAFEQEDWGRGFRGLDDPEFTRIAPFGVIPVLIDDGAVVRESNTILRYLAAKQRREDLYPTALIARADVDATLDWASTDLYQEVRPVFLGLVVKAPAFLDPAVIENGRQGWVRQMQRLDAHLAAKGPYVMGQTFTIADIPIGLIVNRWFQTEIERPALAHVQSYYDRLALRPAYRVHGRNGTP